MRRGRVLAAALLALAALVGSPTSAQADEARVKFLGEKMKSDDFRVRTNAALALGAANDDLAVEPLCGGLSDGSEVVRQASAVALKRLARSSARGCLEARQSVEGVESVKSAITRALEALAGSGGESSGAEETIKENPKAKFYISLSSVANSTGRAQSEVEKLVLRAVKQKLEGAGTMQIAPSKETPESAKDVIGKRKLKGLYLAIAVDRFDYADGNLKVKIRIGVFSYPKKALVASLDKTVGDHAASNNDKGTEDRLLELAASLATEQIAQNASDF